MTSSSGFRLTFDSNGTSNYPHGYWHAITNDGRYDAIGPTSEIALANLINVLAEAVTELLDPSVGSLKP